MLVFHPSQGRGPLENSQRRTCLKRNNYDMLAPHGMLSPECCHGVLAMVILGKMLTWLGFIAATGLLLMSGFRFYQGFTGQYAYTEAFGDPVGAAILYLMAAAVTWLMGLLAGHLIEEDAQEREAGRPRPVAGTAAAPTAACTPAAAVSRSTGRPAA